MGFQFDFSFFVYEISIGIQYIPVVLLLSILPLMVGLVFGTGIAIVRIFKVRILAQLFAVIVVFFTRRSTFITTHDSLSDGYVKF